MSIDKVAIITGASRGIGLAIAKKLHREGANVVLCSRTSEALKRHELEFGKDRALALTMDVRDEKSVSDGIQRAVDRFGRIDIVVNNAGIAGVTSISSPKTERWIDILNTNVIGAYHVTRCAVPHMSDGGRVVMMSSVLGKFGVPGYTAYCASKSALIGFTRALALELAPRKITVNALCPGWVDTEMAWTGLGDLAKALEISVQESKEQAMSRVPLGEMVTPDEVANLVHFLCSDAGKNITAQAISICGGSTQA